MVAYPVISGAGITRRNAKFALDLEHRLNRWMQTQANNIGEALKGIDLDWAKTKKAIDDQKTNDDGLQTELLLGGKKVPKLESDLIRAVALVAWRAISWPSLVAELQPYIAEAAQEGIAVGQAQEEVEAVASAAYAAKEAATEYAKDRAAEAAGLKYNAEDELVPDAQAHWPLTDKFKNDIESTIAQGIDEGWTDSQISAVIEASYAFSPDRVEVIADNELTNAQNVGTFSYWRASKLTTWVQWRTSDIHIESDECDLYEAQGVVALGHEFAPGLRWPRAHPRCRCSLVAIPDSDLGKSERIEV